ncbi:hypothetical protein G6M89_02515 [Natronolimnobius sp. AArcel1]|uniref:hypothetical protein n=1 Tax=Natronolimnobius sp. AArcel1 TaxID=1679093 RepID=UPI0013EE2B38|nr:hypothetical protein [Natronolimnobius sp. AArcel1]NGM67894.1 hypothetical protein [Natronolimnobius sp. AArcel1]
MTLIVDATTDPTMTAASSEDSSADSTETAANARERRRIDVTEMPADDIAGFVDENVDTHRVSLENCGARTYLLIEE